MVTDSFSKNLAKKISAFTLAAVIGLSSAFGTGKSVFAEEPKFGWEQAAVYGTNAVAQSLVAGAGAAIHNESFWEGFAYGASSGLIITVGKHAVAVEENAGWPARLLVGFGSSVSHNVAQGYVPLSRLGFDFGPLYLEWDTNNKLPGLPRPYLLPESAGIIIYHLAQGNTLNVEDSLKYGAFMFSKEFSDPYALAGTRANIICFNQHNDTPISPDLVKRHELVHSLQYMSRPPLIGLLPSGAEKYKSWLSDVFIKPDFFLEEQPFFLGKLAVQGKDNPEEKESYILTNDDEFY